MKTAKWIIALIAAAVLGYFLLMEGVPENKNNNEDEKTSSGVQLKKKYFDDGTLKADVELVNGLQHGVAHNYYKDGSLHSQIYYHKGKKVGVSTWFYEDGKPYRETPYSNGLIHGIQKKYYPSGQLMAEIPFHNNQLQPGTKEYSKLGKGLPTLLKLNASLVPGTTAPEKTFIEVRGKHLDKVSGYAAFYKEKEVPISIPGERSPNAILFDVSNLQALKKSLEVQVWLTTKTKMNNKIIIEKRVALPGKNP